MHEICFNIQLAGAAQGPSTGKAENGMRAERSGLSNMHIACIRAWDRLWLSAVQRATSTFGANQTTGLVQMHINSLKATMYGH